MVRGSSSNVRVKFFAGNIYLEPPTLKPTIYINAMCKTTHPTTPPPPPHPLLEFSKPRWLVCTLQIHPCISSSAAASCRFCRARIGATIQLGRELGCRLLLWLSWIILCTFSPPLGCLGHPSNHLKRSRLQGQGHEVNTKVTDKRLGGLLKGMLTDFHVLL